VVTSSRNGHNITQLVDDVDTPVKYYDWKAFLSQFFKPLKKITQYHHFRISVEHPGVVKCKKFEDSPEEEFNLLKMEIPVGEMPVEIGKPGLQSERQWYLYDHIREFCRSDEAKDVTCPLPKEAKLHSCKKRKCDETSDLS